MLLLPKYQHLIWKKSDLKKFFLDLKRAWWNSIWKEKEGAELSRQGAELSRQGASGSSWNNSESQFTLTLNIYTNTGIFTLASVVITLRELIYFNTGFLILGSLLWTNDHEHKHEGKHLYIDIQNILKKENNTSAVLILQPLTFYPFYICLYIYICLYMHIYLLSSKIFQKSVQAALFIFHFGKSTLLSV